MLTQTMCGKPWSNGATLSRCAMCSGERETESASMLAWSCETLRAPTTGKTYGVLCITYASATSRSKIVRGATPSDMVRP